MSQREMPTVLEQEMYARQAARESRERDQRARDTRYYVRTPYVINGAGDDFRDENQAAIWARWLVSLNEISPMPLPYWVEVRERGNNALVYLYDAGIDDTLRRVA